MNYVGKYDATGFFQNKDLEIEKFSNTNENFKFTIESHTLTSPKQYSNFATLFKAGLKMPARFNWQQVSEHKKYVKYRGKNNNIYEIYFHEAGQNDHFLYLNLIKPDGTIAGITFWGKRYLRDIKLEDNQIKINTQQGWINIDYNRLYCMMHPEDRPNLAFSTNDILVQTSHPDLEIWYTQAKHLNNAKLKSESKCLKDRKDAQLEELKFDKIDLLPNDVGLYKRSDYETKINNATDEESINEILAKAIEDAKTPNVTEPPTTQPPTTQPPNENFKFSLETEPRIDLNTKYCDQRIMTTKAEKYLKYKGKGDNIYKLYFFRAQNHGLKLYFILFKPDRSCQKITINGWKQVRNVELDEENNRIKYEASSNYSTYTVKYLDYSELYCMMNPEDRPYLQYANPAATDCKKDREIAKLKEEKIGELPSDVGSYKRSDHKTKISGATDEASINNFFNKAKEAEKTAKDLLYN